MTEPSNKRSAPKVVLSWEEPPKRPGSGHGRRLSPELINAAEVLKEHPGRSARIAEYQNSSSASALAGRINKGNPPFNPEGSYTAVSRNGVVYAQYVGGENG